MGLESLGGAQSSADGSPLSKAYSARGAQAPLGWLLTHKTVQESSYAQQFASLVSTLELSFGDNLMEVLNGTPSPGVSDSGFGGKLT